MKGVPKILGANTTASADEALAVLAPRDVLTAGELVAMCLRNRGEPLLVVVDGSGRIYATAEDAVMMEYIFAVGSDRELTIYPETNGLLSKWLIESQSGWEDVSAIFHSNNRQTVAQVVNRFVKEDGATFALVNQLNGKVTFVRPFNPNAASVALAAVAGAGFTVCYELAAKNTERLIFE